VPDGVLQWFDPATGDGAVVRGGRVYAAAAKDVESVARRPGAHVHFDVRDDHGAARAVNVTLRHGTRVSPHQGRFGTLAGARRPDTKGSAPFAHPHPELGLSLASHPLEVARAWVRCLQAADADTALSLYAPDAVVHVGGEALSGRSRLSAYLQESGLLGVAVTPEIRGDDDTIVVMWPPVARDRPGVELRLRVAHGQLAEQWVGERVAPATVEIAGVSGPAPLEVATHGAVDDGALAYARLRVGEVIDQISEPVVFTRVKLSLAGDPARDRPAIAQATIDIDGDVVRAHVAAHELLEAVDLLQRRLRDRLEHRAAHRRALRRSSGIPEPGEWRHGDLPSHRPDYYDRSRGERQLVRHKTFAIDELTPDEAAYDMGQLGYDFHLFRDLASGQDSILEHLPDGSYRLTRLQPTSIEAGPTAIALTVAAHPSATATVSDAIGLMDAAAEPFVFFANATTGRGNVVYRRYDGHYGLITPE
jgi:hypothetical protein